MEQLKEFLLRFAQKNTPIKLWKKREGDYTNPIYELLNNKSIAAKNLCQIEELNNAKVYFIKAIRCEDKSIHLVIDTKYSPREVESLISFYEKKRCCE